MEEEFKNTIFTFYFNCMIYLGIWEIETENRVKKFLHHIYSKAMTLWVVFIAYMGVLDFVESVPNINKMIYNVCIHIFITGTLVKIMLTNRNYRRIELLRRKLHRSLSSCEDAKELEMYYKAIKDVNLIAKIFLVSFVMAFPSWLVLNMLSDFLGKLELPLPCKWPMEIDISKTWVFISLCLFQGLFAGVYLIQAAALDASMYGLLAQMYREYLFLIWKINKFGEFCDDMYGEESASRKKLGEKNTYLRRIKVKQTLGEIIARQKDLFGFSEDFEYSYNKSMFVHFFAGGTLLCVNGIQAMILSVDFSIKMAYQFGYVSVILIDILYLCWMANKISVKCFEVGTAFYGIPWYKLDVDLQKDICFVILRSQKPYRLTSGNFVELNLRTSMMLLKNIYSWLAMFRQVALK